MKKKLKFTKQERDLVKRYLIWCYKTTKEDLDRIDRYFTQLQVDSYILEKLTKSKDYKSLRNNNKYRSIVNEYKAYMEKKRDRVTKQKFKDFKKDVLNPEYKYLVNRFGSIKDAICHFLGKKELDIINNLYEKEMTKRILEAKDH